MYCINSPAFWWNDNALSVSNNNKYPNVSIDDSYFYVIGRIAPVVFVEATTNLNDSDMIQKSYICLEKILCKSFRSEIIDNFPNFIRFLYEKRNILKPNCAKSAITLIEREIIHYPKFSPMIFLPITLNDPFLYIEALILMSRSNHYFWKEIISSNDSIDVIVLSYLSFFQDNSHYSTDYIKIVSELYLSLLTSYPHPSPNIDLYFEIYFNGLDQHVKLSSESDSICFLRHFLHMLKSSISLQSSKLCGNRAETAFYSALRFESTTNYYLAFMLSHMPSLCPTVLAFKTLTKIPTISNYQFCLLRLLSSHIDQLQFLSTICFIMISNKIWHRSCLSLIINFLESHKLNAQSKEWFIKFIKLLFHFVLISNHKKKYVNRSIMICESLSLLQFASKKNWVTKSIMVFSSNTIAEGSAPSFFSNFFDHKPEIDNDFNSEIKAFLKNDIRLKTFPFEIGTIGFLKKTVVKRVKKNKGKKNQN